jgi:hypothetical protein
VDEVGVTVLTVVSKLLSVSAGVIVAVEGVGAASQADTRQANNMPANKTANFIVDFLINWRSVAL